MFIVQLAYRLPSGDIKTEMVLMLVVECDSNVVYSMHPSQYISEGIPVDIIKADKRLEKKTRGWHVSINIPEWSSGWVLLRNLCSIGRQDAELGE